MHILISPDSFKGSLTAREVISIIRDEINRCRPDWLVSALPMADGGEGTLDILMDVCHGKFVDLTVHGPLMDPVNAGYAALDDQTAVIEMAMASGLPLVPGNRLNPELTTTFGTGELIRDALDKGFRKIIVGVGGSATNDGGIGALTALGVNFYDHSGSTLNPVGKNLINIAGIDISNMHPAIKETQFTIMCDIDNPLLCPRGATYTFSPQKGADADMQNRLEKGMLNYAGILNKMFNIDINTFAGAGAAGGLAAGLMAFCDGKLSSGISTVLKLTHFEEILLGTYPGTDKKVKDNNDNNDGICSKADICKKNNIDAKADICDKNDSIDNADICNKNNISDKVDICNKNNIAAKADICDKSDIATNADICNKSDITNNTDNTNICNKNNNTDKINKGRVDLVITGEGRADSQSAHGKVLWGIGSAASKHHIPVVALTGCLGDGYEELYNCGISKILPNKTAGMSLDYALSHSRELLAENTRRVIEEMPPI